MLYKLPLLVKLIRTKGRAELEEQVRGFAIVYTQTLSTVLNF